MPSSAALIEEFKSVLSITAHRCPNCLQHRQQTQKERAECETILCNIASNQHMSISNLSEHLFPLWKNVTCVTCYKDVETCESMLEFWQSRFLVYHNRRPTSHSVVVDLTSSDEATPRDDLLECMICCAKDIPLDSYIHSACPGCKNVIHLSCFGNLAATASTQFDAYDLFDMEETNGAYVAEVKCPYCRAVLSEVTLNPEKVRGLQKQQYGATSTSESGQASPSPERGHSPYPGRWPVEQDEGLED